MPHTKTKSDNDDSHARSAKAQKAEEVQRGGTAKAGGLLGDDAVPEGGPSPAPKMAKGRPMPATSHADGTAEEGTSSATAGKAEKESAARNAELTKDQHGRGHRKAEHSGS